jgi:hypothetical protein
MSRTSDSPSADPVLGTCPACDDVIPKANLLIAYQTADGWPRMFAECPNCQDPVHPE